MAYSSHVGSFNIDTTKTAGQTQAITGCGFQPKIVLFWWSGGTATGDEIAGGNINIGFGASISDTSRFCINAWSLDAGASSDSYRYQYNIASIVLYTSSATENGRFDFSSMNADGFSLICDIQFTNNYRISYLALGGDDLTNVYIGNKAMPASAGNYDATGVGFQPDVVILARGGGATVLSGGATYHISLGMATGASNQGVVYGWSLDNQATTSTRGYGHTGDIVIGDTETGSLYDRDRFVEFIADGFRLNHIEGDSGLLYFYIALKGGQYSVGDLTTRTDGNDIVETVGFQPIALLFASANRALSTSDVPTANARLSIGAANAIDHRAVAAISDEDALADSETAHANYDSAVYANILDDAIVGLMDLKSIESNGFTCVMDDTDPSACWVTYLAIGATAGGGGTALGTVNVTLANMATSAAGNVYNSTSLFTVTDTYAGNWTTNTGATTGLFDTLNETSYDDADYVRSETNPSSSPVVFALQTGSDPGASFGHILKYRYGKVIEGAGTTINLTAELRQGYVNESSQGSLIAQWTHSNISETIAGISQQLTTAQADSITDYSSLFIRFVAGAA